MWHKFYWTNHMKLGTIHLGRCQIFMIFDPYTSLPLAVFYYYQSANLANFWPSPFKSCQRSLLTFLKNLHLFAKKLTFSSDLTENSNWPHFVEIFLKLRGQCIYHIIFYYTLKPHLSGLWNQNWVNNIAFWSVEPTDRWKHSVYLLWLKTEYKGWSTS